MKNKAVNIRSFRAAYSATLLASSLSALAQVTNPLEDVAQKAVATNPEVTTKLHAYRAAVDAVDVVRAGFRPRVDLAADAGRERDDIGSRAPQRQSLNQHNVQLGLTQLLWDGRGTQREAQRTDHERLARHFELLDAVEQTSLAAATAYIDVQRYRELVQLAEGNYVQHKQITQRIESRIGAGVARGVDYSQADARLALAASNLVTEGANLHDVTTRYVRIVGEPPPQELPPVEVPRNGVPEDARSAVAIAIRQSAAINAAVESVRSARAAARNRESAFQPRVEARLRTAAGSNLDAIRDRTSNSAAEIVLSWNLHNGGADMARVRQQANLINQAMALRDKACTDTRQTVAIAYNDIHKLNEQLELLDRNVLSIEKARNAYLQQYDIAQRSLLDLLNAENELYVARRARANAQYDLNLAYLRTQAGLYQLSAQLGIAPPQAEPVEDDVSTGDDSASRCSPKAIVAVVTDRASLDVRATAGATQPGGR
jgi:adhesin transport system outer membrane protein